MDLCKMNAIETLKNDPLLKIHVPKLIKIVEKKEKEIFQSNKKGLALNKILEILPSTAPSIVDPDKARIQIGSKADLSAPEQRDLNQALEGLKPWRKGPFDIFGTALDSEWDSSIKWDRLKENIAPLGGKRILDIGSSCGYYMFRMHPQKPRLVIGIEPYLNFYFQFLALEKYLDFTEICCLPLKLEEMPAMGKCFDTIFCMGILYHRRSPLDTLADIYANLAAGGEVVLETLVIHGQEEVALFPEKRYAKMNNIYFLPTVSCLTNWLKRVGFEEIRCIDVSRTTTKEQRKTPWVETESLEDFLDPLDHLKTIEGYPAPVRAMFLARARQG